MWNVRIFRRINLWFCSLTLKTEALYFSETTVYSYNNTRYQEPEYHDLDPNQILLFPEWWPKKVLALYLRPIWRVVETLGVCHSWYHCACQVNLQLTGSGHSELHRAGCAIGSLNMSAFRAMSQPIDLITNSSLRKNYLPLFFASIWYIERGEISKEPLIPSDRHKEWYFLLVV